MDEQFNFVIARRWFKDKNQLSCYSYHNTVFYGNMEEALAQLEFIRGRADEDVADQYEIYKIGDTPIKSDI